jgi:hypothetical protein
MQTYGLQVSGELSLRNKPETSVFVMAGSVSWR